MNTLICWAVLLAALPPVTDLTHFPTAGDCGRQIPLWNKHLVWLAVREPVADWPYRAQYRHWQQQTDDTIGLWETLRETHYATQQGWDDDTRRSLAALRLRLGAEAYCAGRLPWIPEPPPVMAVARNNAAGD